MNRALFIFLLAFIVIQAAASSGYADSEEEALAVARRACQDQLYGFSIARVKAFLKKYPSSRLSDEAHLLMAKCFYHQDKPQQALEEFEVVLKQFPQSSHIDEALYWCGEVYFKGGDFVTAVNLYQR